METLIVHLDANVNKHKVKEALKMFKGVKDVSDKITRSDFEELADDILAREMKKADKSALISYSDGKKAFASIKKRLTK